MLTLGVGDGPLNVLALGAHPDDVEIGCGGTLLTLAERRHVTATAMLMTASADRLAEARQAFPSFLPGIDARLSSLGLPDGRLPAHWDTVKEGLEDLARASMPDIILAPRLDDSHQDHRLVAELVTTVWRDTLVLHYEIPKWDGDIRPVTHYVPFSETVARRKIALLDAGYPSQTGRDWWDETMFLGLMRLRGIECRSPYAEGFLINKAPLSLRDRG